MSLRQFLQALTHTGPAWQPPHRPQRGDAVEAWLKQQRDQYGWHGTNDATRWNTLDRLLDDYRLHADTGTPLDQHACENGNVDDCHGCYQAAKGEQR
jgi:hypothetical protein